MQRVIFRNLFISPTFTHSKIPLDLRWVVNEHTINKLVLIKVRVVLYIYCETAFSKATRNNLLY